MLNHSLVFSLGKFVPRPVTQNDADIEKIRDPWFEEAFSQTMMSIKAGEPLRGALTPLTTLNSRVRWMRRP